MSCFEEDGVRKQIFLYVARRSFFVEELKVKLVCKGFSQSIVDKAINLCIQQGFLDDHKLTEQLEEKQGVRWLKSYLVQAVSQGGN